MHVTFLWDADNVAAVRRRGLTEAEVEYAVEHGGIDADDGHMTGWPVVFGRTEDGRTVAVVFRWEDAETIYVTDAEAES